MPGVFLPHALFLGWGLCLCLCGFCWCVFFLGKHFFSAPPFDKPIVLLIPLLCLSRSLIGDSPRVAAITGEGGELPSS